VLLTVSSSPGGMLGSFLLLYCILALYGTALLYKDVEDSGCDPSGAVKDNETCTSSGSDVFGAMLGMYWNLFGFIS
jgi:ATP-binding cassette, subfamily B (MDR/TAP), member 1